jgi:uncharacterized protein
MDKKIAKWQYNAAQRKLAKLEIVARNAMRAGNQEALDKATQNSADMLAIIAAYKNQLAMMGSVD